MKEKGEDERKDQTTAATTILIATGGRDNVNSTTRSSERKREINTRKNKTDKEG